MDFSRYASFIRIGETPTTGTVLPVDTMIVRAVPFVGSGSTITELFDGRKHYTPPLWGYTIELQWRELRQFLPAVNTAVLLMNAAYQAGTPLNAYVNCTDPDALTFDPTYVIEGVVPELDQETITAVFRNGGFRGRSARLMLHSIESTMTFPHTWITL